MLAPSLDAFDDGTSDHIRHLAIIDEKVEEHDADRSYRTIVVFHERDHRRGTGLLSGGDTPDQVVPLHILVSEVLDIKLAVNGDARLAPPASRGSPARRP